MSYTKNKISQYLNVEKVRSRKRETNWHTHTHFSVHRLSWKENGTSGCLVERDILVTVHIPLFIYVFCCCSSVVQLCPTLCVSMAAALQASLSFTISWSSLKFMSIESVMSSNHLILCCLLLPPSVVPSIRVFSNEPALCISWPKYYSFSLVLPMNIQGWFPLGLTDLISLLSKGLSRVISSSAVRRHQFIGTPSPILLSSSHIHTWLPEKP